MFTIEDAQNLKSLNDEVEYLEIFYSLVKSNVIDCDVKEFNAMLSALNQYRIARMKLLNKKIVNQVNNY